MDHSNDGIDSHGTTIDRMLAVRDGRCPAAQAAGTTGSDRDSGDSPRSNGAASVDHVDGTTSDMAAPPPGNTGAKCQVTGRIDWWRGTAPYTARLNEITLRLAEWFGPWKIDRGRYHYAARHEFNNKAAIHFTRSGEEGNTGMCVELPGEALGELPWPALIGLLYRLMFGMRCTRLDLAMDFRGDAVPLIDLGQGSARQGELCHCKVWEPREQWRDGDRIAHGVNFGRRGKEDQVGTCVGTTRALKRGTPWKVSGSASKQS